MPTLPSPPRSLRIGFVLSYFHPRESGAERQALAQGVELISRGHTVHVLTQEVPGAARDEVYRGLHIHRWVRPIRVGPLFGISFVAGVIRGLRKLSRDLDVIHTHQALWEAISTGLGRDAFRGVPVLVQPASSGYFGEAEEMSRTRGFPILRRLALRNRHFAAISADIERQWRDLGVRETQLVRMMSGVDAEHFRPGPSCVESTLLPGPRVVFTGRLHPQKNLGCLLRAWPLVVGQTNANLILVGQGPEENTLRAEAERLGIGDRVQFTGAVADPAEHLRAGTIFVLPSLAEGMSNSLLEAMATALPCVASRIGGNLDLLGDGMGRLVERDRPEDWASVLIELLEDRDESYRIGQRARQRIEAEFALPVVVDRYLELYERLLENQRRGRIG